MTTSFRPALMSEAKPLIGLYSRSGCGKTYSALLTAKGFAGDMSEVGMLETEAGRGEVYADDPVVGGYQVYSIRDDFGPTKYNAGLRAAEQARLKVLIVDSGSHEWEGAGGVVAMATANQAAGKKGMLVWQEPKISHQRDFLLPLLQTPIPLVILCLRARYAMSQLTPEDAPRYPGAKVGDWVRDKDLTPKQSEDILFELMVHGWIDEEHRLHVTKWTKDSFKQVFLDGQPITVDTGKRLAVWAAGGAPRVVRYITAAQRRELTDAAAGAGHEQGAVLEWLKARHGVTSTKDITIDDFAAIKERFGKRDSLSAELLQPPPDDAGEPGREG